MRNITKGMVSLLLIAGLVPVLKADSIFNFEDQTPGTATPLSETNNGVTATFSSVDLGGAAVPGAYDVETNPDGIGSGLRLIRTDASVGAGNPLNLSITLSTPQQSVNLPFALLAGPNDGATVTLTAFLNGTQVGSPVVAPSNVGFSFYSTGTLAFDAGTGNTFNSFLLDPSVLGMGIDDVSVSPSASPISGVPEPASVALMFFGLAGILAYVRRHLHKKAA
ncbi:MAG TPA: PEP-CTERM sorting domain-containing protein [Bryobacteraceae bacterium]|jgi:hypothetical protein